LSRRRYSQSTPVGSTSASAAIADIERGSSVVRLGPKGDVQRKRRRLMRRSGAPLDMVCKKFGIFADAPQKSGLYLVHASQPEKVKSRHICNATLLKRCSSGIKHIAINPAEVITVAQSPDHRGDSSVSQIERFNFGQACAL